MNYRKILVSCLFIVSLCLCSTSAYAETKAIPKVISSALEKYQKEGADHLIQNLLIGSPIEGDKTALSQANLLRQIETSYGKYLSTDLFKTINISQSTTLVYFVMNYEKGPLYGSATVYNVNGKEIIPTFNFNMEINQIIPSDLIVD